MSARPDQDRQASGQSKLNTQFPYLLNECPDQADCRPDGSIWIAILALCMSASGRESTSSGWLHQSSLISTWKEIWSWSSTGRRLDGCKLAQKLLDTVKSPNGNSRRPDGWCLICLMSGRYGTSSGRIEQWTDERPDGMTCSSDGWQGIDSSDL